jgi:hypothetical protein
MKYILLASLVFSATFASPVARKGQGANNAGNAQAAAAGAGAGAQGQGQGQQGQNNANAGANVQKGTPSSDDLVTAASNWQADTSMVSDFLNKGAAITDNTKFKQAALVAFNAEVDELTHKAIIDKTNGSQAKVQAANGTLVTGGAFQDVVDKLQEMSTQGRAAVANIDLINQNRCVNGKLYMNSPHPLLLDLLIVVSSSQH